MRIQAAISAYAPDANRSSASLRNSKKDDAVSVHKKDRVEISTEAQRRLAMVKQRIERGYYEKEAVIDDISDKLSGVLESLES
ncbi:MAG: hypothetical protein GX801_06340 [Fibrobacter sp.]|nr:hypothetical protein [Fibrobacter sp.]